MDVETFCVGDEHDRPLKGNDCVTGKREIPGGDTLEGSPGPGGPSRRLAPGSNPNR